MPNSTENAALSLATITQSKPSPSLTISTIRGNSTQQRPNQSLLDFENDLKRLQKQINSIQSLDEAEALKNKGSISVLQQRTAELQSSLTNDSYRDLTTSLNTLSVELDNYITDFRKKRSDSRKKALSYDLQSTFYNIPSHLLVQPIRAALDALGVPDSSPVKGFFDAASASAEQANLREAENDAYLTSVETGVGNGLKMALEAVPLVLLAHYTGGESLAQAASRLSANYAVTTTAQSIATAAKQAAVNLFSNPSFWASAIPASAGTYFDAKEAGADLAERSLASVVSGLLNGTIEVGVTNTDNGMQSFVQSLNQLGNNTLQKQLFTQYVAAAMEEGLEEVEQNIATALVGKAVYQPDAPVFSTEDEKAILNPLREAKSYLAGTAVSAVLTAPSTVRRSLALRSQANNTPVATFNRPASDIPVVEPIATAVSLPTDKSAIISTDTTPAVDSSLPTSESTHNNLAEEVPISSVSTSDMSLATPVPFSTDSNRTSTISPRIDIVPSPLDTTLQNMTSAERQQLYNKLEQRTGVSIIEDANLPTDGEYQPATVTTAATIHIRPDLATPMTVIKHELTHHLEQATLLYQDFANYAWESRSFERWLANRHTTRQAALQELANRYAARGLELGTEIEGKAERELLATFAAEQLFTDEYSLNELGQTHHSLFTHLYHWVRNVIRCFHGTALTREVRRLETLFNNALRATRHTATSVTDGASAMQLAPQYYIAPDNTRSSAFSDSVQQSPLLSNETKALASDDPTISNYRVQSNREVLSAVSEKLAQDDRATVQALLKKPSSHFTSEDVALGMEAIRNYEAQGKHEQSLAVLEKLREVATGTGQTLQMFSLLNRLTPDGMLLYASRELSRAKEAIGRGRSLRWQESHQDCFRLTEDDTNYIRRRVLQAKKLPEGRDRNIRLAEISDRLQRKLPSERGQAFKAWQRTAMLLNPKTQLRNVLSNLTMSGAFLGSDAVGSVIDRAIATKTGIRTTTTFRPSSVRGLKSGLFASYDDFFRHINTRSVQADRFTLETQGKESYNTHHTGLAAAPRNALNRALNALDRFNSFLLDAGDRPFYEMWFLNSLNGQMQANHITKPTNDMIEIATLDALQRTWQDSNALTQVLSDVKQGLNRLTGQSITGYGLGDVLIKFVKTPANLTKAALEFSPVGFAKAITVDATRFVNAVREGRVTPKQQRIFVRNLANGIVGSLLTAFAGGLAKAGILTGKQDDDSDVASLERSLFGRQPYSFRIGNTSLSYDWAQPVSTTLAIMADYYQSLEAAALTGERHTAAEAISEAFHVGGQILYNQSFMQSLYQFFSNDDLVTGVINAILSDITAPIPQLISQTASMLDPTVRTTYEFDDNIQTAVNQLLYKIPGARNTLSPAVDVLGRERTQPESPLQRAFRSYLNPTNIANGTDSEAGREMYRLYQVTGKAEAIAPTAPNYITTSSGSRRLTAEQKANYQKITGQIATQSVTALLYNSSYQTLSDEDRVRLLSSIYTYARQTARQQVLGLPPNDGTAKAMRAVEAGVPPEHYYLLRELADINGNGSISQQEARKVLDNTDLTLAQKSVLWQSFNSGWKYNPYKKESRYY